MRKSENLELLFVLEPSARYVWCRAVFRLADGHVGYFEFYALDAFDGRMEIERILSGKPAYPENKQDRHTRRYISSCVHNQLYVGELPEWAREEQS